MSVRNILTKNKTTEVIKMKKSKTRDIAVGGLIAALYAVLTYVAAAFGLAYGPVQFRFSEALTILPVFTPAAIPGLTIGCLIANLGSFNAIDLLFGTAATLLSAISTRALRNVKFKGVPWLAPLPPVIFNAVLVGLEISIFYLDGFTAAGFMISALEVGLGQLAVCYCLGLPLYFVLKKKDNLWQK